MRKFLSTLGLVAMLVLAGGVALAADDEKPGKRKGKRPGTGAVEGRFSDKMFEKMDANNDGKVTKAEMKKHFETIADGKLAGKAGEMTDRIFEKIAGGKDHLTKDDVKKLAELRSKFAEKFKGRFQGKGPFSEESFSKMDTNKDGKVTKEELKKHLETVADGKLAGKAGEMADRIFERLAGDKDHLTKDDIKKLAERFKGKRPEKKPE